MKHIRVILVIAFLFVLNVLQAVNPPPACDTVCKAIDLGTLPIPGPCPTYPYGDTILVNGSTDWATYNAFDFSPVSCGGAAGPDVWYKFRSTGSFIYFELQGFNTFDTIFARLWYSQGSCLDMIPLTCEITTNGLLQSTMLTPEVGGEYYLEIGGCFYYETGPFTFFMKSFNECNGCVKNATVELTPAPWFGRYGTSDTVQMCVTIERWDQTTTSKLHAIVPTFGDEWDTTTLTPLVFPSSSQNAFWMWGQNITTPIGALDGFYFDGNGDGDPTNNPGETGNVTTSWKGCWSIATKPFCNSYDAHVEVHVFSDVETGNPTNQLAPCQEYWPIHMGISGWCCPAPIVTITPNGGPCASFSDITVTPVPTGADTFDIVLYNDTFGVVNYTPGVLNTVIIGTIPPGDYLLEVYNVTTDCPSFQQVHIPGPFEIDMTQTVVGCGPNSSSVIAQAVGTAGPYVYSWPNITTFTDSLAFSLDEGYQVVMITDAAGCTVTDSIYVTTQNAPGAYFEYADINYCHNRDTIQVLYDPFTPGGRYTLVSPLATLITVDSITGTISLNGAIIPTPYFIRVKYTVGVNCTDSYVDSVTIIQQPATPIATSPLFVDWCIGSPAPVLSFQLAGGIPSWLDLQTQQAAFNYSFTPPLTWSDTAGYYFYLAQYIADFTGGCLSPSIIYTVHAIALPNFLVSVSDDTICQGDTAWLFANGSTSYSYMWTPSPNVGFPNSQFTATSPPVTTTYSVTVTDGTCTSSQSVTVIVDNGVDCGTKVYNGITPNDDGYNDTWIIEGAANMTNLTVFIYNRWGRIVWSANNYNNTTVVFNGTDDRGNKLPSGTYFYVITADQREPAKGWLELTR